MPSFTKLSSYSKSAGVLALAAVMSYAALARGEGGISRGLVNGSVGQGSGAAQSGTTGAIATALNNGSDAAYVPLPKGSLTFNKDIAPIVYDNCSSCHHPGEVAPFSLLSYADVKKRAKQIGLVTEDRTMPPWKADAGHEQFLDARRLTHQQIGMIKQWAEEGSPEGKPADLPKPPQFTSTWKLGQPDVILQPTETYALDAEGQDVYRCFVISTNYPTDRWVSAIEVHPDNRKVVHHVIAYLDTSGKARQLDAADPGPGYTSSGGGVGFNPSEGALGGWAPGNEPRHTPDGVGILLPKGSDIVLQVHYHKSGKPETDLTKIALDFCKAPVDKRLRIMPIIHWPLRIPAGDADYKVHSDITTPADVTLHAVMPHMHLIGKEMTVNATLPDGTVKKLVRVPDWDFNWQTTYAFKEPVKLPAGSRLDMTARYDNSAQNPTNPSNPPRPVGWGEQTTDEMCIAFAFYTVDSEQLTKGIEAKGFPNGFGAGGSGLQRPSLMPLMKMFDKNGDGKLDEQERAEAAKYIRERMTNKAPAPENAAK